MLKYMLDTNIVIYVIKRRPIELLTVFNRHVGQMCISAITLAELVHGAEKSQRVEQNMQAISDFTTRMEVVDYKSGAAVHYGEICAELERQGQIIGINDLHIAAHARAEGLIIVTNNVKEFDRVQGLRVENWVI